MDSYVLLDSSFFCHNSNYPTFGLRNKNNLRYEVFSGKKSKFE